MKRQAFKRGDRVTTGVTEYEIWAVEHKYGQEGYRVIPVRNGDPYTDGSYPRWVAGGSLRKVSDPA